MIRKRIITVVILCILLISYIDQVFAMDFKFYFDVFNHWAVETIMWATNDVKLFNGYEDGTFKPENDITIGEYTTLLYRASKLQGLVNEISTQANNDEDGTNTLSYIDLNKDLWCYNEIITVATYIDNQNRELKFKSIFPGDRLQPNRSITREEAVILASFFTSPPIDANRTGFDDISSDYKYLEPLTYLVNNEIIVGYEDNTFRPEQHITRAESATIFMKLYYDMEYFKHNYLEKVHLVNVPQYRRYMLFGDYDSRVLTKDDKLYRRAVATLEYISIIRYIPYEERHLYDSSPIKTLRSLRDSGYWNVVGTNYYLINEGTENDKQNQQLYLELLEDYATREDIIDDESIMIFEVNYSILDSLDEVVSALDKWYHTALNYDNKLNSLFLKSKAYIDNQDFLKAFELYENDEYFDLEALNEASEELINDEIDQGTEEDEALGSEENESDVESPQREESTDEITNDVENMRINILELEDNSIKCYFINKGYTLLLNQQYDDAEKALRDGWSYMSSDEYDEDFKGAIKQLLLEIKKTESLEKEQLEEDIQEDVEEEQSKDI